MAYIELKLERDGFNQPWGLRMLGGVDVGAPLTVSRVIAGTASDGVLRVGDVITSVRGQDVTSFTHQDATELFKSAGNTITLTVARGLANGETPVSTPGTTTMDAPFGGSNPPSRKTSQVGKPPARKFSDRRLEYLIPKSFKGFQENTPPHKVSLSDFIEKRHAQTVTEARERAREGQTMQSPTAFLPSTAFGQKPKSPMELQVEESYREQHHEHGMIVDQRNIKRNPEEKWTCI